MVVSIGDVLVGVLYGAERLLLCVDLCIGVYVIWRVLYVSVAIGVYLYGVVVSEVLGISRIFCWWVD